VVREVVSDLDISRLVSEPAYEPPVPLPRAFHPLSSPARAGAPPPHNQTPAFNHEAASHQAASQPAVQDQAAALTPQAALSPADAKAYMQQVALKLKTWQDSLDRTISGARRDVPAPSRTDDEG